MPRDKTLSPPPPVVAGPRSRPASTSFIAVNNRLLKNNRGEVRRERESERVRERERERERERSFIDSREVTEGR